MPRPSTLPAPWSLLAEKLGGVQALADAMLCDVRTVRRWANGETSPDRRAREWILAAFRQAKLPEPWAFFVSLKIKKRVLTYRAECPILSEWGMIPATKGASMTTHTNSQIAKNESLWDEFYNVSALPENDFNALTEAERLERLNRDYPESE